MVAVAWGMLMFGSSEKAVISLVADQRPICIQRPGNTAFGSVMNLHVPQLDLFVFLLFCVVSFDFVKQPAVFTGSQNTRGSQVEATSQHLARRSFLIVTLQRSCQVPAAGRNQ